jgi:hypothetical protein
MKEKVEEKPKTMREQLEARREQLDANKKQIESSYIELMGRIDENRHMLSALADSENTEKEPTNQ